MVSRHATRRPRFHELVAPQLLLHIATSDSLSTKRARDKERNMQNLRRYQQAWWTMVLLAGAVSIGPFASRAHAGNVNMTLHGFCGASFAASTCFDNGTITPTGQNPLTQFGFTRSPDTNAGLVAPISFDLVVLEPDTATGVTPIFTGTNTGVTGSQTLSLVGDWTTGS